MLHEITAGDRGPCLDFGCGRGANVRPIRGAGYAYTGIDISQTSIQRCRTLFPQMAPEAFVLYGGGRIPFADGHFRAVCAFDVLEHLDDLESAAREIDRVLAPGGTVHVTVPHPASERWIRSFYRNYWADVHHVRTLGRDGLIRAFPGYVLAEHRREEGVANITHFLFWLGGCRIESQVGDWTGGGWWSRLWYRAVFALGIHFSESVFRTRHRYVPLWLAALPLGRVLSRVFPKTDRYVLRKPSGGQRTRDVAA